MAAGTVYVLIYSFFLSLLAGLSMREGRLSRPTHRAALILVVVSFVVACLVLFGIRPISVGSDTGSYLSYFSELRAIDGIGSAFINRFEPGFVFVSYFATKFTYGAELEIICIVQSIVLAYAIVKKFNIKASIVVLILYISSFFYVGLQINTIRQGVAVSLFIFALLHGGESFRNARVLRWLLPPLFHYTSFPFVLTSIFAYRVRLPYLTVWFVVLIGAWLGIFEPIFSHLIDALGLDSRYGHLFTNSAHHRYETGFRADFVLLSALPIAAEVYRRLSRSQANDLYHRVFRAYVCCNSIFLCLMFVPYMDRIATYSWVMIPLLLGAYLCGTENRRRSRVLSVIIVAGILLGGYSSFSLYPPMKYEVT